MCPGFDSRTRCHMWADFVGSLLCSERLFSGNSGFPLSSKTNVWFDLIYLIYSLPNRPFARSDHMVQNHTCWWANCAVGLPKQRQVKVDWYELLRFGSPTVQLAHQHVWFCTMWPDRAKGLLVQHSCSARMIWDSNKVIKVIKVLCVRLNETKAFEAQFFHFCVRQRLIRIGRPMQRRIYTGFHRFTEIGQIFENYTETPKREF